MPGPEADRVVGGTEEARDTWQCRYFLRDLPPQFSAGNLAKLFPHTYGPFAERDLYLVGSDFATNVKIRQRTNRIKVKVLLEQCPDGFELWRLELDSELPCSAQVWRNIILRLRIDTDTRSLAKASTPEQVVGVLRGASPLLRCVTLEKSRTLFADGAAYLEVAEVALQGTRVFSLEFKSALLARGRELRSRFSDAELGLAENYMTFITQILGQDRR